MSAAADMKAVAYRHSLPIDDPESLVDLRLPIPEPGPLDLLVQVVATAVNPVDYKVRVFFDPGGTPRVLGWDASGTVVKIGGDVSKFAVGDQVYYCGAIDRPGSNAEYELVDERLVARKPESLSHEQAAALPLTTLTAWESLFERFQMPRDRPTYKPNVLITGAAGGVGSMALQLASKLTRATLIASAARPESSQWATSMGAHHVVDHQKDLVQQVKEIAPEGVQLVLSTSHTEEHFSSFAELLAPFGHLVVLDEPATFNMMLMKGRSIAWHNQDVFCRVTEQVDCETHGRILGEVARMVDEGHVRSTFKQNLGTINAANLRRAHRMLEQGSTIGKIVLSGFDD